MIRHEPDFEGEPATHVAGSLTSGTAGRTATGMGVVQSAGRLRIRGLTPR